MWLQDLRTSYKTDLELAELCQKLQQGQLLNQGFSLVNGLLLKKGRIYLSNKSPFKEQVLHYIHDNPDGGHAGYQETLHRTRADVYWPGT